MKIEFTKKEYLEYIKDKEPQFFNHREDYIEGPKFEDGRFTCRWCKFYMDTSASIIKDGKLLEWDSFNCGRLMASIRDTKGEPSELCPHFDKVREYRKQKLISIEVVSNNNGV